ncbi:MAG: hypothetical protein COB02_06890 [Candidatus Cloacimonadota bacterium]|nr:MAG: hypothetical protein COB02_06890 [Candidatus Cloacimonadota bacterium]
MKSLILNLALSLIFIFQVYSKVIFIERLDNQGSFIEIKNEAFIKKIPIQNQTVQKAIAGYELAQKIAFQQNLRKKNIPEANIRFLSSKRKSKALYIEIDNGNWAYNLMSGINLKIVKNQQITRVNNVPIIKIGRNIPHSNSPLFLGETISHEIGHSVMNALYEGKNLPRSKGGSHTIDSIKSPAFAWIEGFAEYYAATTHGDPDIPRTYRNRSPKELNGSEGYIASVLLDLDRSFNKEDIFSIISEFRPQGPANFLEEYIARYPNRAERVFQIMRKYSGDNWPDSKLIVKYQQSNPKEIDLDGNNSGSRFARNSNRPSKSETLENEIKKTQKQILNIENYLKRLSAFIERVYGFKQNLFKRSQNNRFARGLLNRIEKLLNRVNQRFDKFQKVENSLRQKEKGQIDAFNRLKSFGQVDYIGDSSGRIVRN